MFTQNAIVASDEECLQNNGLSLQTIILYFTAQIKTFHEFVRKLQALHLISNLLGAKLSNSTHSAIVKL